MTVKLQRRRYSAYGPISALSEQSRPRLEYAMLAMGIFALTHTAQRGGRASQSASIIANCAGSGRGWRIGHLLPLLEPDSKNWSECAIDQAQGCSIQYKGYRGSLG